jgi:tRNA pseudouridine55 synthase
MTDILCGFIPVNKAEDFTSFDAVAVTRRAVGMNRGVRVRTGHTGTLDPMATGVLVVLVGRATLAADILPVTDKSYEAEMKFGTATDTLDSQGDITERSDRLVTEDELCGILKQFENPCEISQIPPMYSAVKVNGQRLYDLARNGQQVERKPRLVTIYKAELIDFNEEKQTAKIKLSCSSGTYVRSFIDQLGRDLSSLAHMTSLVRTKANGIDLRDCTDIREIKANPEMAESLIRPIENLFLTLPEIVLDDDEYFKYKNGVKLSKEEADGHYRIKHAEVFIGTANLNGNELKAEKNFVI